VESERMRWLEMMKVDFTKSQNKEWIHIEGQPGNGTRYDLLCTPDPYGGWLIVWPSQGWVWRWFPGYMELKELSKDMNSHDTLGVESVLKYLKVGHGVW